MAGSGSFPLLPPDAAAAAGKWVGPADWNGTVTTYSAAAAQSGDDFVFTTVGDGRINRVYSVKPLILEA